MDALFHPSAGRRFLKTLGFALLQAAIFGSLVGALVYFRTPRPVLDRSGDTPLSLRQKLASPLTALERESLDWRARELGRRSLPVDSVLLAAIDEETLANAREDAHPQVATRPWPRELLGRMVSLLGQEGAAVSLVDLEFPDLSPRSSPTGNDDDAFRKLLEQSAAPTVLTFSVSAAPPPPIAHPLRPYVLQVGASADVAAVESLLMRVLADRRPAFASPRGALSEVWAGASSEDEGRALARGWQLKGTLHLREFAAADRAFQVTATDLLVRLAEVTVEDLPLERLAPVKSLEVPAAPLLSPRNGYGFRDLSPDSDGRVRGVLHLVRYIGPDGRAHVLPSAALRVAMLKAQTRALRYRDGRLWVGGAYSIPMDLTGYSLLRWDAPEPGSNGRGSLRRVVPVWRLIRNLFDAENGVLPHYQNEIGQRAVVLADTSAGELGEVQTSIGPAVSPAAVWGQSIANLLGAWGVRRVSPRQDLLATFALAFIGAFLALSFSGIVRSFGGAVLYFGSLGFAVFGYVAYARHLYVEELRWIAMAGPLVALLVSFAATTVYALRTEAEMYDFVYGALGRYVSPEVARQVFRNVALMKPERREVTLCYTDLIGFGRMLDALEPAAMVRLLNEYLTEITTVVRHHGGQVEYVGDAVLAFFGAPVRSDKHAAAACAAALSMREALEKRQPEWERRFGHSVNCRTGIATGNALVGDLGSRLKSNYTVVGDAVTLARRLEGANRSYATNLLVSEATQLAASDEFVFREADLVMVKDAAVRLYELMGRKSTLDPKLRQRLEAFEVGLRHYRGRRFVEAVAVFGTLAPEDAMARVYLERCQLLVENPPPSDWTGLGDLRRTQTRA